MSLALAFPADDLKVACSPQAAFFVLPPLYGLSLFTTLHSVRKVREAGLSVSLGGGLDSVAFYSSRPGAPTSVIPRSRVEGHIDEEDSDWGPEDEPSAQDADGVEQDVEKGLAVPVAF